VVARARFTEMKGVSVAELQLDPNNPRIRHGVDQNDCLARIAGDRDTFMHLLRDIAGNGLSIAPIVLSKSAEGKLVVRDGNRRVTALKLLNRPDLCLPDETLRNMVQRIASSAASPIVDEIDCTFCDDEVTMRDYLRRLHTGENAGIGQVGWSALLISLFNLYVGVSDQNRRAAQLIVWLEDQGKHVSNDFPITTLTRLLNADTLSVLGFNIVGDNLVPSLPPAASYALASRVINDIASKVINVTRDGGAGSVYAPDDAAEYIRRVRQEVGPVEGASGDSAPDAGSASAAGAPARNPLGNPGEQTGTDGAGTAGGTSAAPAAPSASVAGAEDTGDGAAPASGPAMAAGGRSGSSATVKPNWDRPCLFGRRKNATPGFTVPTDRAKIMSIVGEMRLLDPNATPLAMTMLFRALLELSDKAYREAHGIKDKGALHKDIAASADHMLAGNLLNADQHSVVLSYTRSEQNMLHVKSIQKYVHDDTYHPNGQALNTMWDEIGCFVKACWA
jgi:hypothetical protein